MQYISISLLHIIGIIRILFCNKLLIMTKNRYLSCYYSESNSNCISKFTNFMPFPSGRCVYQGSVEGGRVRAAGQRADGRHGDHAHTVFLLHRLRQAAGESHPAALRARRGQRVRYKVSQNAANQIVSVYILISKLVLSVFEVSFCCYFQILEAKFCFSVVRYEKLVFLFSFAGRKALFFVPSIKKRA